MLAVICPACPLTLLMTIPSESRDGAGCAVWKQQAFNYSLWLGLFQPLDPATTTSAPDAHSRWEPR